MAFKFRGITQQEKQTYDFQSIIHGRKFFGVDAYFSGNWTIDEQRDAFLLLIGKSPSPEVEQRAWFAFSVHGRVAYFAGRENMSGETVASVSVHWDDTELWLPDELVEQKPEVIILLREALWEYGTGTYRGREIRGVEVSI